MSEKASAELVDIIKKCMKEDRSAQNQLYRRYYSYAMSIAMRYVSQSDHASEVVNDAFYKVFKNIKNYDPQREFRPWISRILVNTALTHIKKEKKHETTSVDEIEIAQLSDETPIPQMTYDQMVALIQTLSASYRTVFNMYVIDGYQHDEIADHLGISVGTSKSNLARAKANLRALFKSKLTDNHV